MSTPQQHILRIAVPTPLRRQFDYLLPQDIDFASLQPGIRIKVPFGRREIIGVLLEIVTSSPVPVEKLKPIIEILDQTPVINPDILKLCKWGSEYYHHSIGEVLAHALPKKLRQGKEAIVALKKNKQKEIQESDKKENPITLNLEQKEALTAILKSLAQFQCFLLYGVTGSGKTEVYLQVIQKVLDKGEQALVLVPEIALTPQTINRFARRFDVPIVSFHSGLNDTEKLNAWLHAKTGHAKIIIGTRSAVFTPCQNLGVIIIDEEHDLSFKQQTGFRYSARDFAIMRANMQNIPIVLGSATPSLETLYNAQNKRYHLLSLPERAGSAIHPDFKLIDIKDVALYHGLSRKFLKVIEKHIEQNNQVLLFLNRRGYAPVLMCHGCGWVAKCKRCDVNMTLHSAPPHLHCHHCDTKKPLDRICPECGNKNLKNVGVGTEQLEAALEKQFPGVSIVRIDRDTTRRKNSLDKMLSEINSGQKQLLVGTQMLAKGHHFPNVTLVGVLNADYGFFSADFRATERIGQLLLQVAGRAGRAEKPGEVFIQTHHPENPLLLQLINEGYTGFAEGVLQERNESQLPPYSYFSLIRARALKEELPEQLLTLAKDIAEKIMQDDIMVLGPIPSPMPRRKSHYHAQLLLQSSSRPALQELLHKLVPQIEKLKIANKVKWSIDVDPLEMF